MNALLLIDASDWCRTFYKMIADFAVTDGNCTVTAEKATRMTPTGKLLFAETTRRIISSFYAVYNKLGHGFLESVYQRSMIVELTKRGVPCAGEVWLPVYYEGMRVGDFRADIIVDGKVIVETKTVAALRAKHDFQIINYLKANRLQVGLVLNFGPDPNYQRFIQTNFPVL